VSCEVVTMTTARGQELSHSCLSFGPGAPSGAYAGHMNLLDRIPRLDADRGRFDGDGFDVLHVLATVFGAMLLVLGIAAVVLLVWNSFKVRAEVRALSADVGALRAAQLASAPAGSPAGATAADTPADTPADAPADASDAPAPKAKPKRAPRKKPTDTTE